MVNLAITPWQASFVDMITIMKTKSRSLHKVDTNELTATVCTMVDKQNKIKDQNVLKVESIEKLKKDNSIMILPATKVWTQWL